MPAGHTFGQLLIVLTFLKPSNGLFGCSPVFDERSSRDAVRLVLMPV